MGSGYPNAPLAQPDLDPRRIRSTSRQRADRTASRRTKPRPAWWAPSGFAGIPTAALDPSPTTASPAVPAFVGSGSPSFVARSYAASGGAVVFISAMAFPASFSRADWKILRSSLPTPSTHRGRHGITSKCSRGREGIHEGSTIFRESMAGEKDEFHQLGA